MRCLEYFSQIPWGRAWGEELLGSTVMLPLGTHTPLGACEFCLCPSLQLPVHGHSGRQQLMAQVSPMSEAWVKFLAPSSSQCEYLGSEAVDGALAVCLSLSNEKKKIKQNKNKLGGKWKKKLISLPVVFIRRGTNIMPDGRSVKRVKKASQSWT